MLALAIPLVLVSFSVLVALAEKANYGRLRAELRQEVERVARVSGRLLAEQMWFGNTGNINSGLEVLLGHDAVTATVARDPEGALLAWCAETASGVRCAKEGWPGDVDTLSWRSLVEEISFEQIGTLQPAGELEIYYTEDRVSALMAHRLGWDAVLFLLLFLSLLAGIFVATRRAVLMPLNRWRQAIRAGREGGLGSVDWTSADEFGELIREYNERVNEERQKVADVRGRAKVFEDAFESLRRGFCIFDRDFRLTAFNRRYLEILDHAEGTIETGMSLKTLLRANAARGEYGSASVDAVIIDRLAIAASNEHYLRERDRPDGTVIEVESSPTPDGGFVSLYTDITQQKAFEGEMRRMTLNDTTTGLPNRALFHDRLRQALALADRLETSVAVLLVDIDQFRHVSETHGQEVADEVLKEAADRLRQIVRKSDTAARLEADRFAVVQQDVPNVDDVALLAHRILGGLSRAVEIGELTLKISASVGITLYPDDDRSSRNILKNAHLALTAAKAEGENLYRFFVPEVDRDVASRRRLEEELFNGLRDHQFVLYYQPRVDLETGALTGVEASLRWRHPKRGLLPPSEFMELAEERGLAVPLTEWMLEEACRQRLDWKGATNGPWRVGVPLSARHFGEADVVGSVRQALDKTSLDHELLEVGVSAAAVLENPDGVAEGLEALRAIGVASAVEDLGNGASQLPPLQHLPVGAIRIDRHLIHDLDHDSAAAATLRALISLGKRLELRVTATGVENPDQLRRLREEGCDEALGELVSPPLASDELAGWVTDRAVRGGDEA